MKVVLLPNKSAKNAHMEFPITMPAKKDDPNEAT